MADSQAGLRAELRGGITSSPKNNEAGSPSAETKTSTHAPGNATVSECAKCKKPATKRCLRCIEGVDIDGELAPTYYCSKECQTADWTKHKVECRSANDRKQLFRAGVLLEEIYLTYLHVAFALRISDIVMEGESIHIYSPPEDSFKYEGPFVPFPEHLVTDDVVKNAVLTFQTCNASLAFMHELIKRTFDGKFSLHHDMENFSNKGGRDHIRNPPADGDEPVHDYPVQGHPPRSRF